MAPSDRVSFVLALGVFASSAVSAIEINTGTDDLTLTIGPQIQPRFEVDFDGPRGSAAPSGHANFDFFIRRARLLVRGTAYKQFTFAILLIAPRLGERGNYNVALAVQDAHIGYVPVKDVNIEMGLLYMPLTHAALSSATDTSALEVPGDILLYNNARNLREGGVQLRALFLERRILVRGESGVEIVAALAPLPGEIVVDKPGKGAFYATDLGEILRLKGITHLLFAGVTTEVCVQTTMREANDRGYECLLIEDATESYFPEFKQATLQMVRAQGGIVGWTATTGQVLAALSR